MQPRQTIVIEKVENGFIVRSEHNPNTVFSYADHYVFQDIGYASLARDYQNIEDTLLGFIAKHFSDTEPPK